MQIKVALSQSRREAASAHKVDDAATALGAAEHGEQAAEEAACEGGEWTDGR